MNTREFSQGLSAWSEHQAQWLPWLRKHSKGLSNLKKASDPDCIGVAVLIEPRIHDSLEFVVRNFAHFLAPHGWGLHIVHGPENEAFVKGLFEEAGGKEGSSGASSLSFFNCGFRNLTAELYNRLLTTQSFWEAMPHETLLLFQTDTLLLRGISKHDPILAYDYVGAPWSFTCFACGSAITDGTPCCGHMIDQRVLHALAPNLVGNGGLSLRKRSACLEVVKKFCLSSVPDGRRLPLEYVTQEDVYFCQGLTIEGKRVAPREVAATFACEQVPPPSLSRKAPSVTGLHKPYAYLSAAIVKVLLHSAAY